MVGRGEEGEVTGRSSQIVKTSKATQTPTTKAVTQSRGGYTPRTSDACRNRCNPNQFLQCLCLEAPTQRRRNADAEGAGGGLGKEGEVMKNIHNLKGDEPTTK